MQRNINLSNNSHSRIIFRRKYAAPIACISLLVCGTKFALFSSGELCLVYKGSQSVICGGSNDSVILFQADSEAKSNSAHSSETASSENTTIPDATGQNSVKGGEKLNSTFTMNKVMFIFVCVFPLIKLSLITNNLLTYSIFIFNNQQTVGCQIIFILPVNCLIIFHLLKLGRKLYGESCTLCHKENKANHVVFREAGKMWQLKCAGLQTVDRRPQTGLSFLNKIVLEGDNKTQKQFYFMVVNCN